MYGFVYITTNLINGKRYLGLCSYGRPNHKRYLGSGKALKRALEKYGRENFSRQIVTECETKDELFAKELELIDEYECATDKNWYNILRGTKAGYSFLGKKHTEETKQKMRRSYKRVLTEDGKRRLAESSTARILIVAHAVIACPHCQKEGKLGPMYRWHFDNCLSKPD